MSPPSEFNISNDITSIRNRVDAATKMVENISSASESITIHDVQYQTILDNAFLSQAHSDDRISSNTSEKTLKTLRRVEACISHKIVKFCGQIERFQETTQSNIYAIRMVAEVVINQFLKKWKREQEKTEVADKNVDMFHDPRHEIRLHIIQRLCTELVTLMWITYRLLRQAKNICQNDVIVKYIPSQNNSLCSQISEISKLLQWTVGKCFIVEEQPPRVVEAFKRISSPVTVSLLLDKKSFDINLRNACLVRAYIDEDNMNNGEWKLVNGQQLMQYADNKFKACFDHLMLVPSKTVNGECYLFRGEENQFDTLRFNCDVVIDDLTFTIDTKTRPFFVRNESFYSKEGNENQFSFQSLVINAKKCTSIK